MEYSNIQKFVHRKLIELLNTLDNGFDENELAYLSAQGKNELQIRDKIAWRLHKEIQINNLGEQYVVRKEWGFDSEDIEETDLNSHSKVDLAVLELSDDKKQINNVLALIEFKAQSIIREEKWYRDEFVRDMEKMKLFTNIPLKNSGKKICENADLYFIFLETGQSKNIVEYAPALGFKRYTNGTTFGNANDYKIKETIKQHWSVFCSDTSGHYNKKDFIFKINKGILHCSKVTTVKIGRAYGYELFIAPLVIGPIRGENFSVSEKRP